MPTYRFQPVTHQETKSVPCAGGCGKKVRRQRTFSQTLNPFNKNAAGQPKTVPEIVRELTEKAKEWQAQPETCRPCTDATEDGAA